MQDKKITKPYKDLLALLVTIAVCLLVCNLATPYMYRKVKTDRYRTTLILNALKDSSIRPDIVVFGHSASMMGIDGYQMCDELQKEVYNLSSVGQRPVESSLYYSLLPSSVKIVIQVIDPPIQAKSSSNSKLKAKIEQNIVTSFSLSGYKLSDDIVDINQSHDLSDFNDNFLFRNFKSRASFIIPALTYAIIPRDKRADQDLKFCNSYLTNKHEQYNRTIDQLKPLSHIRQDIMIDNSQINTLNEYTSYLQKKGIATVYILMPCNPDLEWYTKEQINSIGRKSKEALKNAVVLNYMDVFSDSEYFFDAAHMNKEGAKVLTKILDEDLKKILISDADSI